METEKKRKGTQKAKRSIIKFSYERIAFALIWSGLGVCVFILIAYYFREYKFFGMSDNSINLLGQIGQYISGIVGSVWALAGVILFYEALRFQRGELKLQREELQYQRVEIMEQTNQYIIQNQTLMARNMEGTFFQLISLHNEIVDSMNINFELHPPLTALKKASAKRRYCFSYFYKYFSDVYKDNIDLTGVSASDTEKIQDVLNESFKKFYWDFQEDIGHYFRNLYNLLLYVDKSKLENKKFYSHLIRAMLSNFELVLLFYYCLSQYGNKMKILVERYSVFVQLSENELLDRRNMNLFDKKAFEEEFEISI